MKIDPGVYNVKVISEQGKINFGGGRGESLILVGLRGEIRRRIRGRMCRELFPSVLLQMEA